MSMGSRKTLEQEWNPILPPLLDKLQSLQRFNREMWRGPNSSTRDQTTHPKISTKSQTTDNPQLMATYGETSNSETIEKPTICVTPVVKILNQVMQRSVQREPDPM